MTPRKKADPPPALLSVMLSEGGDTLTVAGELDVSNKAVFAEAAAPVLDRPAGSAAPHLDLTQLDFLDSAGLEALVAAHRQLVRGGDVLRVRLRAGTQPARVLKLGVFQLIFRLDIAP